MSFSSRLSDLFAAAKNHLIDRNPALDYTHIPGVGNRYVAINGEDVCVLELPSPQGAVPQHDIERLEDAAAYLKRVAEPADADVLVGLTHIHADFDRFGVSPRPRLTVPLAYHWQFAPWAGKIGVDVSKREFVRFLVENHSVIIGEYVHREGATPVPMGERLTHIAARLNMTGKSDIQTQMDETGAVTFSSVVNEQQVNGKFPTEFSIVTPVYQCLEGHDEFQLDLKLRVQPIENGLKFTLLAPGLQGVLLAAREAVRKRMVDLLGEEWLVVAGTPRSAKRPVNLQGPSINVTEAPPWLSDAFAEALKVGPEPSTPTEPEPEPEH